MRADRRWPTTSSRTTSCRPTLASRDAARRRTPAARSRPTRSPATSGTTSPRQLQGPPVGRRRSPSTTRSPASRGRTRMPGGGRGYTRPASLISLWSTAPFLLNNTLGTFEPSPSVEARMQSFQDSIEKMLWPERRRRTRCSATRCRRLIDRTTTAQLHQDRPRLSPGAACGLLGPRQRLFPWLFRDDGVEIGPIPAGYAGEPDHQHRPLPEPPTSATAWPTTRRCSRCCSGSSASSRARQDGSGRGVAEDFAEPGRALLELSKCPDFVVNRGHYFGTALLGEEPGLRTTTSAR